MIAASLAIAFSSLLFGLGVALDQARSAQRSLLDVEKQKTISEQNLQLARDQQQRAERHLQRTEQAIDQLLNRVADELALMPRMTASVRNCCSRHCSLSPRLCRKNGRTLIIRFVRRKPRAELVRFRSSLGSLEKHWFRFSGRSNRLIRSGLSLRNRQNR